MAVHVNKNRLSQDITVAAGTGSVDVAYCGDVKRICIQAPAGSVYDLSFEDNLGNVTFGQAGIGGTATIAEDFPICETTTIRISSATIAGTYKVTIYGGLYGFFLS